MSQDPREEWHLAGAAADIDEGDVVQIRVEETAIAVYNVGGAFFATNDLCTHARAYLSEGYVDGDTIECPLHQGVFHIPTGKALKPPVTCDLRTYPVEVRDDKIYVRVGSSTPGPGG